MILLGTIERKIYRYNKIIDIVQQKSAQTLEQLYSFGAASSITGKIVQLYYI